jgi:hypothetical protein
MAFQLRSACATRSVVIFASELVGGVAVFIAGEVCAAGLAGMVPGVVPGVACVPGLASAGAVGIAVCATANPTVPTIASALAEVIRTFEIFM